jgi:transposase
MNVRYRVELSQAEREDLTALLSGGRHAVRRLKRAQILLAADAGVSDEVIATSVGVGGSIVYRTKRRFVEGNLKFALNEEARPGAARKLTGKEEALLIANACTGPPEGRKRWTLNLLAGEMVKLTGHEELSSETVRRRLRSASCAASVSAGASVSANAWSPRLRRGSASATHPEHASHGCSPPSAHVASWPVSTPIPPKSLNLCVGLLVQRFHGTTPIT